MVTMFELETERLLLRPWKDSDYDTYARMSRDPDIVRFFPGILNRVESDAEVDYWRSSFKNEGWGFWALEEKTTKEFVGYTGLMHTLPEHPFPRCVEIGWKLARSSWGKGYATEAARRALAFGFTELGQDAIFAYASVDNAASIKVIKRLGMSETPLTFEHPFLVREHPYRLTRLYRIGREEWIA